MSHMAFHKKKGEDGKYFIYSLHTYGPLLTAYRDETLLHLWKYDFICNAFSFLVYNNISFLVDTATQLNKRKLKLYNTHLLLYTETC